MSFFPYGDYSYYMDKGGFLDRKKRYFLSDFSKNNKGSKKMKENNRVNIYQIIFLIASIMMALIIFMFSNQDGDESKTTSKGFTKEVVDVAPPTKNLEEEKKQELVEDMQPTIRKMAHFTIYTLFGIFLFNFFRTFKWTAKKQIALTLIIGAIYAISDEIHQFFSDGRSPLIKDVIIDSFGVLFGITIVLGMTKLIKKRKRNT